MLAVLVVLGLAVWGLLWAAAGCVRAGHGGAGDVSFAPEAETPCVLQTISRGAGVRRSFSHASRAPGPLCERVFVSNPRRKSPLTGPRAFRPAPGSWRRAHVRVLSVMRSVEMRA